MKSVIVPVFSDSDLKALPNALRYLARQNVEILLVIHGPNVGVVNAEVTKEFDSRIAQLDTKKRELTLVEDYIGASRVKEEIETARVERDMAVREGWKNVPEEQRQTAYKKAFANIGTEPMCLREAYQPDQLFTMLQAFLPQFPSDIAHGEYAIVWPRSVASPSVAVTGLDIGFQKPPKITITKSDQNEYANDPRGARKEELQSMHHTKVLALARKAEIDVKGVKVHDLITALLDKEFPAQLASA